MAAGRWAAPGTEYGPCEDAGCRHTDCAAVRRDAASPCALCDEAIGYENSFYIRPDYIDGDARFVHANCLLDWVHRNRFPGDDY